MMYSTAVATMTTLPQSQTPGICFMASPESGRTTGSVNGLNHMIRNIMQDNVTNVMNIWCRKATPGRNSSSAP